MIIKEKEMHGLVNDIVPYMTWVEYPVRQPSFSNVLYVAECNNGFISTCIWAQINKRWKCFYSIGKRIQLGGVTKWLAFKHPSSYDAKANNHWKKYEIVQPKSEGGLYVIYSDNGFITVCRWNSNYHSFRNMSNTRNINSVLLWMLLPNNDGAQHITHPLPRAGSYLEF